ncbi:MAG: carbohydrate kinase [Treponema sp.]|jgi:sugar (pentulose or hexulose) kinase|nr:carbohydrate kinase [Treponema sp.]
MEYAVAVIDIGMTNKKIAVYDEALRQLDARYQNFAPKIVNGLETHDLEGMEAWFCSCLKDFAARYPVKALAVTTHGATFVCTGKDGKASIPCVYYTHEPGEDFHRRFYEQFGEPKKLQERTGTPVFKAMINAAKYLFFAKEQFPGGFKDNQHILPYPQYWGLRFTGNTGAECTHMGNHNYLWDYIDQSLSSVAKDLSVASLIPAKVNNSWDILGTVNDDFAGRSGLSKDTIVTMGIHDSNSSLLPHFAKKGEGGFILNSTGTWCVIMNPVEHYGFTPDELGKVVFFNISAFGKPVKTAIFLGGMEFDTWSKLIMKGHNRTDIPGWNETLYRSILEEKKIFLLPELTPGSGQFPNSRARVAENGMDYYFDTMKGPDSFPPCFTDYDTAFAALRISLVMQTQTALERTGLRQGQEIYTEGGFRKDESYNRLLSSAFPGSRVFLTDIAEATALGAAMTAKMALTNKSLSVLSEDFEIEYRETEKSEFPELETYRAVWLAKAENREGQEPVEEAVYT